MPLIDFQRTRPGKIRIAILLIISIYPTECMVSLWNAGIDLFSLYVLFSHFRPRDATRGNSFFQMSSYARANLRITNEKTKGKFP